MKCSQYIFNIFKSEVTLPEIKYNGDTQKTRNYVRKKAWKQWESDKFEYTKQENPPPFQFSIFA